MRKGRHTLLLYLTCLGWLLATLFPFYWLFNLSLKTAKQAFTDPPLFLFTPTFQHYRDLFVNTEFPRFLGNSILVALGTVACSLGVGVPAAYAFSRWAFRGRSVALAWILMMRMVPGMTYVIPFFIIYRGLGLLDTRLGLIILYTIFNLALTVWSMHTFFDEMPRSLEEAAYVDGASIAQAFWRIVLPLTAPGLIATAVLCFLFSWNEFLFALVITRNASRTAPLAIVNFMAEEGTEWGRVASGAILILIPVLLFSALVRRYLVKGLLAGAVKG